MTINIDSLYSRNYESKIPGQFKNRAAAGRKAASGASGGEIDKNSKLFEACQDFEAIFLKQMLNVMRKTVNKGELLNGGFAEDVFEDMLYDEYAKKMAKNSQFGLSEMLYRELSPGYKATFL